MIDYSIQSDSELDHLARFAFPDRAVCRPSDIIGDADMIFGYFLENEEVYGRYWNCTQEIVLEQRNGIQTYIRKATLFRGVAPDGVCYSVKRDTAARALTEVILMAMDGAG